MARTKQIAKRLQQRATKIARGDKQAAKLEPADRKPRRWRSGTVSLREIRRYQKETGPLIPKLPFSRLVRGILTKKHNGMRCRRSALPVLQEAAEKLLCDLFEEAQHMSIHAKRQTVQKPDFDQAKRILKIKSEPEDRVEVPEPTTKRATPKPKPKLKGAPKPPVAEKTVVIPKSEDADLSDTEDEQPQL